MRKTLAPTMHQLNTRVSDIQFNGLKAASQKVDVSQGVLIRTLIDTYLPILVEDLTTEIS